MTHSEPTTHADLPDGHVAAIVTYLEMHAPPSRAPAPPPPGVTLARDPAPDPAAYRALYRRIGTDYLWSDRLRLDEADLAAILGDPAVEVHVPERDGDAIGLLELDFRDRPSVEIAYFGLVPDAVGAGVGRWLMDRALQLAWRDGVDRVWLHTCTLDHPSAVGFYLRSGFVAYARTVELTSDPRLDGILPDGAAPHVPVIGRTSGPRKSP